MNRKTTVGGVNKKLGIHPPSIVNSIFTPPGQSVGQSNGLITRPEFLGFWAAITQTLPPDENPLIKSLVQQLQGRLKFMYAPKNEERNQKKKDKNFISESELLAILESNSCVNTNSIVTTLAFILFSPFKFDIKLIANWLVEFQRTDYAMSVPDCVKNLAIFIKFRCLLENVGWDDTEFRYQDTNKKILNIDFEQMKALARDQVTGAAGAIEINGDIFAPLIIAATKIIQTPWIPMLSLDETDIGSNECGFLYTYLSDIASTMGKDYQLALISSLFDRAHLISQGGAQPAIREQTFLSIVHMVRCFFTQGSIVNVTLLRRGLLILQSFFLWQHPFGKVAETLILLIQYELLAPGYSFRTFIQRECNVVDYHNPVTDTFASTTSFHYTTKLENELHPYLIPHNGYTQNKPLFYIYDNTDRRASSLLTIIDPIEFDEDRAVPVTPTNANGQIIIDEYSHIPLPPHPVMLLSIVHSLSFDTELTSDELYNIKHLTYEQLKPFYVRVITLQTKLTSTNVTPTVALRRKEVNEIKTDLLALSNEIINDPTRNNGPVIMTLPTTPETHHKWAPKAPNTEHVHIGVDPPFGLADHPGFPAACCYDKLLSIFHSFVSPAFLSSASHQNHRNAMNAAAQLALANNNSTKGTEDSEQSVSRGIDDNISRIRNSSIYNNPTQTISSTIKSDSGEISHHNQPTTSNKLIDPPNGNKRVVRLAILGSSKFLSRVVTAYQKIIQNHGAIFDYIDVKFMIIPTGENWLANYLARNDLWYFRHLYSPFAAPAMLIPWIRDEEVRLTPQSATIGQSYPCQFLRACAIQYAQQALYTLPITIYKVDCSIETRSAEPAATVYFIQRLELGTAVAVEEFRLQNPSSSAYRLEEIQQQKGFVFPQLEMSIGYSKCDLMGVTQPEIVEDAVQFQSLTLSNIPTKIATSSPINTAVQLDEKDLKKKSSKEEKAIIPDQLISGNQNDLTSTPDPTSSTLEAYIHAPRADKSKLRSGSLLADPKQHLSDIHCASLTAFKVRVDGVNYGPFKYIHISPCTTTFGQISKFNIQTFFPVGQ